MGQPLNIFLLEAVGPYGPLASCPCMGLAGLGARQAQTNFPLKKWVFFTPTPVQIFGLVAVYGNTFICLPGELFVMEDI